RGGHRAGSGRADLPAARPRPRTGVHSRRPGRSAAPTPRHHPGPPTARLATDRGPGQRPAPDDRSGGAGRGARGVSVRAGARDIHQERRQMRILGVNAVFHDPAAAVVVDGRVVAAAEEERFTRRKHGKPSTAMAGWELPERAIAWCLAEAGLRPEGLDAVTYSYDPARVVAERVGTEPGWEWLRTAYVERAPRMLATALPGLDPARVRYVSHHLAHAASAALAAPEQDTAVLVADGRGEADSHVSGLYRGGRFHPLARTELPSSLGLCYEDLTAHRGFDRGADAYKVMALGSYGRPVHADALAGAIAHDGAGGFHTGPIDWSALAPPGNAAGPWGEAHADLAASVQN